MDLNKSSSDTIKKLQGIKDDLGWFNPESQTDQFVIKKLMDIVDILVEDCKKC